MGDDVKIPNNVVSDEAQQDLAGMATDYALKKVGEGITKSLQPTNTDKFLRSEAGHTFLSNVQNLRAIYELSKGEGKSDEYQLECLARAFPEEMADVQKFKEKGEDDIAQATLDNLVSIMASVHAQYPKLATSTDYVIKPVNGQVTYVAKKDLDEDDKDKVWPETTGQYVQAVADYETTFNDNPIPLDSLYPAVAQVTGQTGDYRSQASKNPTLNAFFFMRSGDMRDDDELQTKAGNYTKAFVGDMGENFLNLLDPSKVARVPAWLLRGARSGVKGANAFLHTKALGNTANKLGNASKRFDNVADWMQNVATANPWVRATKGAVTNVGQTAITDLAGQAYDAKMGTDRGDSALSTDNWKGLALDALLGFAGGLIANPDKAQLARQQLWKKIQDNKSGWGGELLKAREQMKDPWLYANDIDPEWMSQYLDGKPFGDFARDAYKNKQYPDIHLKQSANPIENEQAHIDKVNAQRAEQNQAIKERNDAMDERASEYRDYMDEREQAMKDLEDQQNIANASDKLDESAEAVEKQEQNVANLEQKIANEKQQKMAEDWNKLNYYGPEGGNAERKVNDLRTDPHYQNPYPERKPNFEPRGRVSFKGHDFIIGTLDGKPAIARWNGDVKKDLFRDKDGLYWHEDKAHLLGNPVTLSNEQAQNFNKYLAESRRFPDTEHVDPTYQMQKMKRGEKPIKEYIPEEPKQLDNVQDIANKGRMQNAVEVLGNRKEALNKATADYNSAVEQSLKAPEQRVIGVDEYRATHPQHEDYIPMMKNVEFETDKIISGNTDSRTWNRICQSNWQRLGYKSAEDMRINMPIESRKALAQQMEQSLRDQGWREGIGAHKPYTVEDWGRYRAERAEPKEQSKAVKEQSYENSANKYQHDLMATEYEFPEGTSQDVYDDFKKANEEFGLRYNYGQKMGSYKGPSGSNSKFAKTGRALGGWLIPTVGRYAGKADYNLHKPQIPVDDGWEMSTAQKKK